MKKLALALVCLIGVAFLSSCDPKNVVENPEPSIAFMTGDTYIQDGDVLDYYGVYQFGVRAASNPETLQDLARFVIKFKSGEVEDTLLDTVISGKEFSFEDYIYFYDEEEKTIIGSFELIAEVTDAAGEKNAISMSCDVDWDETLEAVPFEWRRDNGADGTGLEAFGLKWTKNVNNKTVAVIEPLEGATLVTFDPEDWTKTTTITEKYNLFTEQVFGIAEYKEISTTASHDYDLVIGTIYNDEVNLIHITHCEVYERGWHFVVTGEAK